MNDVIKIDWGSGWMQIAMTEFFPCTKSKFKKLKRIIDLDQRADQIRAQIQEYFKFTIATCDSGFKQCGKEYWRYAEEAAEFRNRISNRTKPNGGRLTEKEIKDLEKHKRFCNTVAKSAAKTAEKYKKQKAWFEEMINQI